jgi:hypothetical protein
MLQWFKYLDRVLRGEATHPTALKRGEIDQPTGGLAVIVFLFAMGYGLCMGSFSLFRGGNQATFAMTATMFKVPALFFLTVLVTFPSLYVFNALMGSRLSLLSLFRLLIISLAVMVTVLVSLGPVVAFFSASTPNYHFMLLFNVAVCGICGIIGMRYMLVTLHRLNVVEPEMELPEPLPNTSNVGALDKPKVRSIPNEVMAMFRIWILLFGIVGGQMAWILRPFLGTPERVYTLFRGRESSFFEAVIHAIQHLFGIK